MYIHACINYSSSKGRNLSNERLCIYMYKYSNEVLVCKMIGVCHVQSVFLQVLLESGADPRLGADDGERPEQVIGLNFAVYMYIHVRTHTCMYTVCHL